jgi:hypothetical protein
MVSIMLWPIYPLGIQLKGGWVGPRAGLDVVAKRKIPAQAGNRTPVFQSLAGYFTD